MVRKRTRIEPAPDPFEIENTSLTRLASEIGSIALNQIRRVTNRISDKITESGMALGLSEPVYRQDSTNNEENK